MAVLAAVNYDPGTAVSASTASLLAMTALDTTNLRLTFTAPPSGNVLVRLRCCTVGATTFPRILLGVLDGSTVKMRMSPLGGDVSPTATELVSQEAVGLVTGLTPGTSYTWDAAYGVEVVLASTNIKYGGPNDTAGADAYGGFVFEVWECQNLLGGVLYDPSSAATKITTSLTAMTAFDTTNMRLTVTAPNSGNILWRLRTQFTGSGTYPAVLLGVLEGATVVGRVAPVAGRPQTITTTGCLAYEASGMMTGVTAGSHTYDAAYAVQVVSGASGAFKGGGPNDTTTNNAFGGYAFELWAA